MACARNRWSGGQNHAVGMAAAGALGVPLVSCAVRFRGRARASHRRRPLRRGRCAAECDASAGGGGGGRGGGNDLDKGRAAASSLASPSESGSDSCVVVEGNEFCEVDVEDPEDDENCVVVEGNEFCEVDVESSSPAGVAPRDSPLGLVLASSLTIVPFFLWGTTMVAMKSVLPHTSSPFFVAAIRCVPAGALILGLAKSQGKGVIPSGTAAWLWVLAFAAVDATAFQGFLIEGLERTNAGLGSVIIDSQPISVALASSILFGETLGVRGYVGLALGVVGISLVEVPAETMSEILSGLGHGMPSLGGGNVWDRGEWWMLLAAQSMAAGTLMVRYFSKHIDPVVATGWHLLLGGIPLAALALRDGASSSGGVAGLTDQLTGGDWASLGYASVLGGAVGYGVFFYLASKGNLTKLSALTFLTPLFACAAGFVTLGERLDSEQLLGAVITIVAISLITVKKPDESKAT